MTVKGVQFKPTPERDLVNAIREVLGKGPIYEDEFKPEAVRFHQDYSYGSGQVRAKVRYG